jgi:2-phosphosulfolactate phosphatase
MSKTVTIDCFPSSVERYREGYSVVAIDVIRATTTMVTAVNTGRRAFPVPSIEYAVPLAARLDNPLLVGELGGNMPYGFDMNNSPAEMASRKDVNRPMILLSSSGTQTICNTTWVAEGLIASLRNYRATAEYLATVPRNVALIGAGTRGEFREEDQLCCAWIAELLIAKGYGTDSRTHEIVERWHGKPVDAICTGNSAEYLRRSGQTRDLDYVLTHVDDIDASYVFRNGEILFACEPD